MTPCDHRLSETELAAYRSDGFLVRESVFSADDIEQLRLAAEQAEAWAAKPAADDRTYYLDGNRFVDRGHHTIQFEHQPQSDAVRVIEPVHDLAADLEQLIDRAEISGPMRQLVGSPDLALWTSKLNLKPAECGSGFGWHQDSPYWIHNSNHVDQLPNVLITLDAHSEDNGCFAVIRGSHRQGVLPGTDNGTQLGGFFTDPTRFSLADRVAMTVPTGSLVFFDPHSVHGSAPNRSCTQRRAIILTYQPGGHAQLKSGQLRAISDIKS